jgi:hypothetical protein
MGLQLMGCPTRPAVGLRRFAVLHIPDPTEHARDRRRPGERQGPEGALRERQCRGVQSLPSLDLDSHTDAGLPVQYVPLWLKRTVCLDLEQYEYVLYRPRVGNVQPKLPSLASSARCVGAGVGLAVRARGAPPWV